MNAPYYIFGPIYPLKAHKVHNNSTQIGYCHPLSSLGLIQVVTICNFKISIISIFWEVTQHQAIKSKPSWYSISTMYSVFYVLLQRSLRQYPLDMGQSLQQSQGMSWSSPVMSLLIHPLLLCGHITVELQKSSNLDTDSWTLALTCKIIPLVRYIELLNMPPPLLAMPPTSNAYFQDEPLHIY